MGRIFCAFALLVAFAQSSEAYVYNQHRFPGNTAYYYVNLDSFRTCLPTLDANKILADIQLAASSWHDQTNANFSFVYAGQTGKTGLLNDGVTTVYCDAIPSAEQLLAQTYYWFDGTGYVTNFDIAIYPSTYPQYPYITSDLTATSNLYLLDILIHEFGHGLSLNHSADPNATMFAPTSINSTQERTLYSDDILAIETVYGVRNALPPPPDPTPIPIPPPPVTECVTSGVTYPAGAKLTQTMKTGQVGTWLSAREAEGWALLTSVKAKSQTTVTLECGGS